jgi:YfiH family protein
MTLPPQWIVPADLPHGVGAVMTTRAAGVSRPPWDSLNVGDAVGDEPQAVAENRRRFVAAINAQPVFLRQVHGSRVLDLDRLAAGATAVGTDASPAEADASVCTTPGRACAVQVADCMPVLLAAPLGRGVAAAHAGWRGLAGGVLEATVTALCERSACAPGELWAWMGPCIGPRQFEVGADVLQAFGVDPFALTGDSPLFRARPGVPQKWLADLPALARLRLARAGVVRAGGGSWCTIEEPSRFFSFRRDRVTGRMAAAIWLLR